MGSLQSPQKPRPTVIETACLAVTSIDSSCLDARASSVLNKSDGSGYVFFTFTNTTG